MSIWVQHGYGKSDKIMKLHAAGLLSGIIMSPANEDRADLRDLGEWAIQQHVPVVLDPQSYVYTIANGSAANHRDHGIDLSGVHWSAEPEVVEGHLRQVIEANRRIGTTRVIAPTPLQGSFADVWSPLALQYARAAARQLGGDHVYVSVTIDDTAFNEWDPVDEWSDVATTLEVKGFYIVVNRGSSQYPSPWRIPQLANLLRLVYRLAELNGYEVILGYSELEGLAAVALGGQMATGWTHGLRRFHEGRWQPSSGGGAPAPRIFSERLLVPLLVQDAQAALRQGPPEVVSPDAADRQRVQNGSWGLTQDRYQYLVAMGQLSRAVRVGDVRVRVQNLEQRIASARQDFAAQTRIASRAVYDGLLAPFSAALDLVRTSEHLGP